MKIQKLQISLLIFFLLILINPPAYTQNPLRNYIEEGLSENIVLKQKNISLQKAMYALKTASSYFFPTIKLEGDYTSGEGGRNIAIPVGDMLNPVYSTLNFLTKSNAFPQLDNVKINFFPFHYYDVKLRTTMPLLNTDIIINRDIRSDEVNLRKDEIEVYKRELVKDIKTAYYNYLSAVSAVKIYENSLKVAEESKRVNEALLKNGKGLPVYILRSETEIEDIKSKITEAENRGRSAERYFNFLLNRNLDAGIDTSYNIKLKFSEIDGILSGTYDLSGRAEIKMLEAGISMNRSVLQMNKLYWVPKISAFLDLGAQDQIWNYNSDSRYYLFGFQLSVPIFEAFRNNHKIDEAELDLKNIQYDLDLEKNHIKLTRSAARDELIAARQNYFTATKKYETAGSYERLIEKGYKEGVNTFIETVDARSQLMQSELMLNINTYKVLSALAEYERETAASPIFSGDGNTQ